MNRLLYIILQNRKLFGFENEGIPFIYDNIDGPKGQKK